MASSGGEPPSVEAAANGEMCRYRTYARRRSSVEVARLSSLSAATIEAAGLAPLTLSWNCAG